MCLRALETSIYFFRERENKECMGGKVKENRKGGKQETQSSVPNEEPDEATGSYQGEVQTSNFIIVIVKKK